jgi:cellulose 1,4-beta-cellobiosidase
MLSVCIILLSGCAGDMTVDPLDTTAPTSPAGLTATAVSQTRIDLAWSAATDDTGVTGYRVYRDVSILTTATGTGLSNTGLQASTQYCYSVSGVDAERSGVRNDLFT